MCGGGRDHRHISIHAPRVGGDQCLRFRRYLVCISIHAPRVGGDPSWPISRSAPRYFNPRPPCGGRPFSFLQPCPSRGLFQSTPPVWGATQAYRTRGGGAGHFNPRPPCGGRPLYAHPVSVTLVFISIHAPRVGGDVRARSVAVRLLVFQSTPPVWGATSKLASRLIACIFQSTPPVWGATIHVLGAPLRIDISIHAPRVGGDIPASVRCFCDLRFQSTPPVWGATV